MPNPIFALQSLRLSNGNEQNLCNLAHCRVLWSVSSPPSRERQGGVNRVPQALQACILMLTRGKSGEVREVRGTGDEGRERNWHPHAYPVAPRRDPTAEWCFLRCIMLKISRVGSRLAATYRAMVLSTVATFAIYQFILYFCSLKCK